MQARSTGNGKRQAPHDKITHNAEGHDGQIEGLCTQVVSERHSYPEERQEEKVCPQRRQSVSAGINVVYQPDIPHFLSAHQTKISKD